MRSHPDFGFALDGNGTTRGIPAGRLAVLGDGDGVVSLSSARLDSAPQLESQITVPADHISAHRHPQSILEVRRILLEQFAELQSYPYAPDQQVARSGAVTALPAVESTAHR